MKQNILALYLIKFSKWFSLVMPIIVLFYEDHGLGLQDVFILKSVYSVAAVTLEIPSGYLADVWVVYFSLEGTYVILSPPLSRHFSSPRFCWEPGKPW